MPTPCLGRGGLRPVGGHIEVGRGNSPLGRGDIEVGWGHSEVGNARRGLAEFALEPFDLGLGHIRCDWRSFKFGQGNNQRRF